MFYFVLVVVMFVVVGVIGVIIVENLFMCVVVLWSLLWLSI